jgi:hypothetical protein
MYRAAQGTIPPIATIETGITATAGGTKAAARVLTAAINVIATCATGADSVLLPAALAGLCIFVTNRGAASAQVFGAGTDTIDDVATGTGVAQANGKSAVYTCTQDGKWYRVLSA